ncbi:MAG: SpoIIE family protein phosphatase [Deltaproteobacteria bacterium]|nr:SpoIIE family protein phosphatase [Deltaproteobacteria bacterium]
MTNPSTLQGSHAGSLEALLENARLLHGSLELEALLKSLLRSVMGKLVVSRGLIALEDLSTEGTQCHVVVSRGFRELPQGCLFDPEQQHKGIARILTIGDPHKPTGHLALGKPLRGELGPQEIEFLEALLGIASSAIENARSHQRSQDLNRQLDRRVQQLRALLDLVRSLTSSLEPQQVAQILGLTLAGQWLVRRYAVIAWKEGHASAEKRKGMSSIAIEELASELEEVAQPQAVEQLSPGPLRQALEDNQAVVVVPLVSADRAIGLVALGQPAGNRSFEAEDLEFCAGLAAQAVVAFENAWYFAETVEQKKLERDLALAGEIQQRLFPSSLPQPNGFQVAAHNRPALQVGGDYYDALPIGETAPGDAEDGSASGHYLLCVADVSGKGVAASLLMSTIQATLRALLCPEIGLAELVSRTSALVFATTPASKYATAFFLVFNPEDGSCRYVNAGHNEGLVVRKDGTVEALLPGGLPVGLFGGGSYQEGEFSLQPGDFVALYSDGVNEANNAEEEEWEMDRFKAALLRLADGTADEIVQGTFAEVDAFAAGAAQYDDITLLVLKRDG